MKKILISFEKMNFKDDSKIIIENKNNRMKIRILFKLKLSGILELSVSNLQQLSISTEYEIRLSHK